LVSSFAVFCSPFLLLLVCYFVLRVFTLALMEKALQLVFSQQVKDVTGNFQSRRVPTLRPASVEMSGVAAATLDRLSGSDATALRVKAGLDDGLPITSLHSVEESPSLLYNSNKTTVTPPPTSACCSATKSSTLLCLPEPCTEEEAIPPQNSPSVLLTSTSCRTKLTANVNTTGSAVPTLNTCSATASTNAAPSHADPMAPAAKANTLLKSCADSQEAVLPNLITYDSTSGNRNNRCVGGGGACTAPLLGVSDSSDSVDCSADEDADKKKMLLSDSGESKEAGWPPLFKAKPRLGEFMPMIGWLLRCGESGEITMPPKVMEGGTEKASTLFSEDGIMKLCAAATQVLSAEPSLLYLNVAVEDTLVVVGDIHGQFQDLYTSVLCQQYDRRRCNPGGADRRFLFMGDYVDRGPHSLEVVLLLLALKVEYPSLIYLTRGNHEEEKTSRVYGFLTEATSSLGAAAGAAVWSAVNKVFLDLPLAAVVTTPRFRFLVMHGGLSPALQTIDQIASIDRHSYNTGELSKEAHDIVDGLLWSDPAIGIGCFAQSARGCGWSFGPATSNNFCTKNRLNFICRAHQLAMDGYFWTHNDRVVTVFSAPNYCGINDNRGAVMVVNGNANKPSFDQYEYYEDEMEYGGGPSTDFPYSSYFC
jgi:diadenosine tetraphosphatase ApaH/serine/threonine PP2A family protein phosphatase